MAGNVKNDQIEELFTYILSLENMDECYMLFEDLCTVNELHSMTQRMIVAKMLDNKNTYVEIAQKTGASTATISRVNRALNYGNKGYKMAIEKLKNIT